MPYGSGGGSSSVEKQQRRKTRGERIGWGDEREKRKETETGSSVWKFSSVPGEVMHAQDVRSSDPDDTGRSGTRVIAVDAGHRASSMWQSSPLSRSQSGALLLILLLRSTHNTGQWSSPPHPPRWRRRWCCFCSSNRVCIALYCAHSCKSAKERAGSGFPLRLSRRCQEQPWQRWQQHPC
jgi:hypothetical protein